MRRSYRNGVLGVALLAAALAGCAHRDDAPLGGYVQDAADMKYQRWRMNEVNYFVSNLRCGSGPFEIRVWNQPGAAGDEYNLYIYTPRALKGHVAAKFNGGFPDTEPQDFHQGGVSYNEACAARPEELAASGGRDEAASAATGGPAAPRPSRRPSATRQQLRSCCARSRALRTRPKGRACCFWPSLPQHGVGPGLAIRRCPVPDLVGRAERLPGRRLRRGPRRRRIHRLGARFQPREEEIVRQRLVEEYRRRDAAPPPPPAPEPPSGPPPPCPTSSSRPRPCGRSSSPRALARMPSGSRGTGIGPTAPGPGWVAVGGCRLRTWPAT